MVRRKRKPRQMESALLELLCLGTFVVPAAVPLPAALANCAVIPPPEKFGTQTTRQPKF